MLSKEFNRNAENTGAPVIENLEIKTILWKKIKKGVKMLFTKFLDGLKTREKEPENKLDPQKEIEEYNSYLKILYDLFKQTLRPYEKKGKVQIKQINIRINEESLGSYDAPQLILKLNTIPIQLKPEGTMLIGAKGRVRMIGPKRSAKIILMRKDFSVQWKPHSDIDDNTPENTWVWRFVGSDNVSFIDVTKSSIQNAIMEVVNG